MTQEKEIEVKKELSALINRLSLENLSDTPDWILGEYLFNCLIAFSEVAKARDKWYSGVREDNKMGWGGSKY